MGFGEKGQRFHERDMGKPMETLVDLKKQGYWLAPPRLDAASAREAPAQTKDGAYYSIFSNQYQDWAHPVRRRTLKIQRARGIADPLPEAPVTVRKVPPTVPAAWYLGMIAMVIGCLGFLACAAAAWTHRDEAFGVWILGATLSGAFIQAEVSTLWLNFGLRTMDANADETDGPEEGQG